MAIKIEFTCNICATKYERIDGKNRIPEGWGAVRPTLRINMPLYSRLESKKDKEEWNKLSHAHEELKKKLWTKEVHICHNCLMNNQSKLLERG